MNDLFKSKQKVFGTVWITVVFTVSQNPFFPIKWRFCEVFFQSKKSGENICWVTKRTVKNFGWVVTSDQI